ncbi:coniferyl aldehyde dehydrogenase [Hyphomicrobium sp. MC1]|uniref:coniferyl aldehyde dehydrogenase n=1 Tax=Hyphomicrobium sp. (strain MC1) TaxID=717785 RepID=UPI000213ED40|nr:coniferyl aldehyde dehydrogenase [Hyphomicrobium sp. MC1]CCB64794.1 putative coniferyl aldehyde dehydrogenase [Hyphomicrobium sp. MC1]
MTAQFPVKDDFLLSPLLAKQRAAFMRDGPPSAAQRRADLRKLKRALLARRAQFEAAISKDFGYRSAYETRIMEVIPIIQAINFLRRNVAKWMRPEKRRISLHFIPGRARVHYQPLGVVGIVSPWNYPLSLAIMPLLSAIAAGNRAILKPSELTVATSELLKSTLRDIFPEDQVAVVTGGPELGAAFSRLPFDHLVFTGSAQVGRMVMREAAENLVPVTLELGGKSPTLIGPDADIETAASSVAYGKLANAGQTCIAPDYVLVHEKDAASFVASYDATAAAFYPDGAADKNYSAIASARHYTRLRRLLEDAENKGARVIQTGPQTAVLTRKLPSAIVLNVTDDMAIMREEIFGPILPIVTYRTLDEAIAYINHRPRPLALYYFGNSSEDRLKVLARTTSGNVTVNDTLMHYVQNALPFGGVGMSGMGAYHGIEGFKSLSHAKGVFEQSRWNLGGLLRPPFNRTSDWVIRYLLR